MRAMIPLAEIAPHVRRHRDDAGPVAAEQPQHAVTGISEEGSTSENTNEKVDAHKGCDQTAETELQRHSLRFLVFRFLLLFSSATRAERLLRKIHLVTRSLRTGSGPWTPAYKKASRALAGPRQCFQQTSHSSDCDCPGRSNPLEQSKLLGQTKPLGPEARLPSRPARHTCRPPRGSSACVTSPRIPLRLRRA